MKAPSIGFFPMDGAFMSYGSNQSQLLKGVEQAVLVHTVGDQVRHGADLLSPAAHGHAHRAALQHGDLIQHT